MLNLSNPDSTIPSEKEVLQRDAYIPGYIIQEQDLTGANTAALVYIASRVLSISEIPIIAFHNKGGFNILFRLEFPKAGRKLLARIPLKDSRSPCRIECCVATMSFARHVRGIPTPTIFAWNASLGSDNAVGAPFVIQEYVDNVVEPWQAWVSASEEMCSQILEELARYHAAFLAPLPESLRGVGDLIFAPGLSGLGASVLSDPKSYVVRPLQLRSSRPFVAASTSPVELWHQLWSHQNALCISDADSIDIGELDLDDDDTTQCDAASFKLVASHVHTFSQNALKVLSQHPQYAQPCLVNYDYAYRNILLDPQTLAVKAFIDWDDVHVMPFVIGIDYPEDIKRFPGEGLAPDSNFYTEGQFPSFPPDEHGEIVGEVDNEGRQTDIDEEGRSTGVEERDERIQNTMFRETYVKALGSYDQRVAQDDMWEVRRNALKAHHLLTIGGAMWWEKRQWLSQQV